ncbi:hypothetical protein HY792_03855 [Candidatus Desantisbacteria bacterium]|nr:hypothetical protein [Candidatus Desantisbacteria bacterium]
MLKKVLLVQFIGFAFILSLAVSSMAQEKTNGYGFDEAFPELHVFLTNQFYDYQEKAFGDYADRGDSKIAGHSVFIPMSGYIDISSQIGPGLKAEAEFELYRAEALKYCKLRGVWSPRQWFSLSMGRDFVPLGTQDKSYYPTSGYRMFTVAPFLYRNVMRACGWWDAGVHVSGEIPVKNTQKLLYNLSIINGPGREDIMGSTTVGATTSSTDTTGYMYEQFHNHARQAMDNNNDKPLVLRLSYSPFKGLEFGGSHFKAKYDKNEKYGCDFTFHHLLYDSDKWNVACEHGRAGIDTKERGKIHQSSAYLAASYKLLKDEKHVHFLAPAIRYETFDSWEEDPSDKCDRKSITVGINLSPYEHFVIRTAYQHTTEKGSELKNDGVSVESVFEF